MTKKLLQRIAKIPKYGIMGKSNNNVKMTKAMKSRIKEANEQSNEYFFNSSSF